MFARSLSVTLAIIVTLVVILTIVSADEEEEKTAAELSDIMCNIEMIEPKFFLCMATCMSMLPYFTKNNKEPNAEARKALYKNGAFNPATQKAMCTGMPAYNESLKKMILDLKGGLRPQFASADGMAGFFDGKIDCMRHCNDGNFDAAKELHSGMGLG